MAGWTLNQQYQALSADFGSLETVFALQGQRITRDPLSEVIRIERDGVRYYVKRYWGAGKGLRRYLGRPRVKAEWQNLKLFAKWGVPTAAVVAYGLERQWGRFVRGALITRELANTEDLAQLARRDDSRLGDPSWVDGISRQLARATRILHDHHFTHNDLKWRNLLVDDQAELFFIDRLVLVGAAVELPHRQGSGLPGQGRQVQAVAQPAPALLPGIPWAPAFAGR